MGKSLKNAVSPDDMYDQYGADTLRLYEMATGPLDASRPWETRDVVGHVPLSPAPVAQHRRRDHRRVHRRRRRPPTPTPASLLHRTIDVVRTEMDALRFNTAIAKLIELNNAVTKLDATPREVAEPMVLMAAPLVPHIAEELWRRLGHADTITYVAVSRSPTRHCSSTTWSSTRSRSTARCAATSRSPPTPTRATRRSRRARRRRRSIAALDGATPEEGHRRARPHGQHRRLTATGPKAHCFSAAMSATIESDPKRCHTGIQERDRSAGSAD